MKRLLLPLLAAFALPASVNAETVWLLVTNRYAESFEKIEMKDMNQCKEQGEIIKDTKFGTLAKNYRYMCVVGK